MLGIFFGLEVEGLDVLAMLRILLPLIIYLLEVADVNFLLEGEVEEARVGVLFYFIHGHRVHFQVQIRGIPVLRHHSQQLRVHLFQLDASFDEVISLKAFLFVDVK